MAGRAVEPAEQARSLHQAAMTTIPGNDARLAVLRTRLCRLSLLMNSLRLSGGFRCLVVSEFSHERWASQTFLTFQATQQGWLTYATQDHFSQAQ